MQQIGITIHDVKNLSMPLNTHIHTRLAECTRTYTDWDAMRAVGAGGNVFLRPPALSRKTILSVQRRRIMKSFQGEISYNGPGSVMV